MKKPFSLSQWLASGALLGTADGHVLLGLTETQKPSATAFYAPDFFLRTSSPWLYFEQVRWIAVEDLLRRLEATPCETNDEWIWTAPYRPAFETNFEDLQCELEVGRLHKGVPFAFERANVPGSGQGPDWLAPALLSVLRYSSGRAVFPYGFWSATSGMLGCTPEVLFQQSETQVHTVAIAGTRIAGDLGRTPLLDDIKERREHQVVIDAIVSSLENFGDLAIHDTGVAHYPNLSHLKTAIDLDLHACAEFEALVKAMHPTPALGAYPRQQGWQWLKKMESRNGIDRGRFGAPFGAVWDGGKQAHCVVSIRNIQWSGADVLLCAGCGVNEMSVLDREWEEIQGKIRATKSLLGLGGEAASGDSLRALPA